MGSTVSRLSIAEVEEIQKECPQCKKYIIYVLFKCITIIITLNSFSKDDQKTFL